MITYFFPGAIKVDECALRICRNPSMYNGIDTIAVFDRQTLTGPQLAEVDLQELGHLMHEQRRTTHLLVVPQTTPQQGDCLAARIEETINAKFINTGSVPSSMLTAMMNAFGSSNHFQVNMATGEAQCYEKAALMAGIARSSGLHVRIVGYDELPQAIWEKVTSRVEGVDSHVLHRQRSYAREELLFHLLHQYPALTKDKTSLAHMVSNYRGPVILTPDNHIAQDRYKTHFWVEFETQEGWSSHNTITSPIASPYFDEVFAELSPTRFIVPEFELRDPLEESAWHS